MTVGRRRIHVAAAVIGNQRGEVLITRRPSHVHQGGLWEFPGGKLEAGEGVQQALARELHEELGITVVSAQALIQVRHDYPDKSVLLDVWRITDYAGTPAGREGQPLAWARASDLERYAFPAANLPIIKALQLPERYLITPEPGAGSGVFLDSLERALARGCSLVQLRAKQLSPDAYRRLALAAAGICRAAGARLLLNCEPRLVPGLGAQGVHLTSRRLMELSSRPLDAGYLVAASCHNVAEVRQAGRLGLDLIVVSPVYATASHPGAAALGLAGLRGLCEASTLPVYALGGVREADIDAVRRCGAVGIAAIRALWS